MNGIKEAEGLKNMESGKGARARAEKLARDEEGKARRAIIKQKLGSDFHFLLFISPSKVMSIAFTSD